MSKTPKQGTTPAPSQPKIPQFPKTYTEIKKEFFPYINPLFWCPNAILTPHIAGSTGKEPQRMAYYMMEEMEKLLSGTETKYEVTLEALERMA